MELIIDGKDSLEVERWDLFILGMMLVVDLLLGLGPEFWRWLGRGRSSARRGVWSAWRVTFSIGAPSLSVSQACLACLFAPGSVCPAFLS